ncbi:MAG: hypothetical protein OXD54_14950 [Candidatus Poribacteria bacterium]|nr:hypothetical protein [Candidatus Poribacteria bacterium]
MSKQRFSTAIVCFLSLVLLVFSCPSHILAQNLSSDKQNVSSEQLSQIEFDGKLVDTALNLDGNLSFVEIDNSKELNNIRQQLTVSLWIKPTDIPNRYASILAKTDKWIDGITHRSYVLNLKEGGFIQFAASPDSTNEASLYSPPNIIKLNKWYHIAGVIDPNKDSMKLFINGVEVGRRDFKGRRRLHRSQLPLRIGWSYEDRIAKSPFVGYIDEVRIWNIARKGADIRKDMNKQLNGNEHGLVGYWKLDKETDEILSDSTSNQNNGKLEGNAKLTGYLRPLPSDASSEQLTKAAIFYENILTEQTNFYDAYRNLGEIYLKIDRNSDAEKVYLQALKKDLTISEYENAIQRIYELYKSRDAVKDVILILEEMRFKMEGSPIVYELLGDAYKSVGNGEKAKIAYTQWLKIRQNEVSINKNASDYRLLAEDLLNKNLFPDVALELSKTALEIYSGSSYIITNVHAILMNEMYDQAFLYINNILHSGYSQYSKNSLYSRIANVGKNVTDEAGYVEMLEKLIDAFSDNLPVQLNTIFTLALFFKENDMHVNANKLIQQTGFVMEDAWMILGPFDNVAGIGFHTPYIPENLPQIDINAEYEGLNGPVSWRKHTDDLLNGHIDLSNDVNWSVSYANATIISPDERKVQFRFDSNDQGKIWINGIEIHSHARAISAVIDREILPVTLNAGKNSILVKVCEENKGTGFYLRITDKDGKPYDDLIIGSSDEN